jgi:hypothetical protein
MNAFGFSERTASLQMNGEKRAVLIGVGIRDEQRLKVLLAKSLTAMASLERDVESMSDADVNRYLEQQASQNMIVTKHP